MKNLILHETSNVVVIATGILFFGSEMNATRAFGALLTIAGVVAYDFAKVREANKASLGAPRIDHRPASVITHNSSNFNSAKLRVMGERSPLSGGVSPTHAMEAGEVLRLDQE